MGLVQALQPGPRSFFRKFKYLARNPRTLDVTDKLLIHSPKDSQGYGCLSKLWSPLSPLNTRCRIILRTPKGTIILTTAHIHSARTVRTSGLPLGGPPRSSLNACSVVSGFWKGSEVGKNKPCGLPDRAQNSPQTYTPQPEVRTKEGSSRGYPSLFRPCCGWGVYGWV